MHFSGNVALDTLYGVGKADSPQALMCMAPPDQPAPPVETVFPVRCGYGERLPLLVVSPYAQENVVDHTLVDQTSVLRFIEDNWGLPRLGAGLVRRATRDRSWACSTSPSVATTSCCSTT